MNLRGILRDSINRSSVFDNFLARDDLQMLLFWICSFSQARYVHLATLLTAAYCDTEIRILKTGTFIEFD